MKTLLPGTIFASRYEIHSLAGKGGMGHVYRARHLGLQKDVALKVLGANPAHDFAARFEREARAIARLDHPGCVRILDHGHVGSIQYIAMELVEGHTLAQAIKDAGRFRTARALHVTRALLKALAHAHRRGVLHRDIKPENVMLAGRRPRVMDPDGRAWRERVVLIDFGLSTLQNEAAVTAAGMCFGSPSYIAPERLLGGAHEERSDLYAVGVMLYEMLAGVRPFSGKNPEQVMRSALHRPARPLRAIRRDISPFLDKIVRKALAKDPDKRFGDAEDMLSALEELPAMEQAGELDLAAVVDLETEPTTAIEQLVPYRPPWYSRLWTWLRYGGWRLRGYNPSAEISLSLKP